MNRSGEEKGFLDGLDDVKIEKKPKQKKYKQEEKIVSQPQRNLFLVFFGPITPLIALFIFTFFPFFQTSEQSSEKLEWHIMPPNNEIKFPEGIVFKNSSGNPELKIALKGKGISRALNTPFIQFVFSNKNKKDITVDVRFNPTRFSSQIYPGDGTLSTELGEGRKSIRLMSDFKNHIPSKFSIAFFYKKKK